MAINLKIFVMKKLSFIVVIALSVLMLNSCKKAEPIVRNESTELADIYGTLEGQGGLMT